MSLSARAIAVMAALTALSGIFFAAILGSGGRSDPARAQAPLGSPNVKLVTTLPGTAAISGVFSRSAPYFYVSGLESVSVIDVTDPKAPKLAGKLANAVFENEAMTLGERKLPDGSVQRFLLIGNDLGQASLGPAGYKVGRVGGRQLIVVDVTDPANPKIAGETPSTGPDAATTSTHTVACMDAACTVAYSAGGTKSSFSIFDLSDLTKPRQVKTVVSPAAGEGPIGQAGHHWNIDGAGIAWHTGSGGTAAFDVSDPLDPQLLNSTDAHGTATPYNDFIHHNSQRPNARAFKPGRPVSVENGNVALVTEEDYANEGDEVVCDRAGTFQTWEIPDLDGAAHRAANPKGEPNKGTIRPLDTINPPAESKGGLSAPAGGFCSAHWFDYHQSGVVAQGFYQQGLRLINVRNPRDLQQFGYFTAGASEVWDAYWAPERDATGTVVPGRKTNVVYTVDAARGVDVYEVSDLPADLAVTGDEGSRGTFPAAPATAASVSGHTRTPIAGSARCGAPTSRFTRGAKLGLEGLALRGTAAGRGCAIAQVRVAVGRKVGRQCRFLAADGTFGAPRSCLRTQYLKAKGTRSWSFALKARLPRGTYLAWSRAIDTNGAIERKAAKRNLLRRTVR